MGGEIIRQGDRTSHGGTVLEGSLYDISAWENRLPLWAINSCAQDAKVSFQLPKGHHRRPSMAVVSS